MVGGEMGGGEMRGREMGGGEMGGGNEGGGALGSDTNMKVGLPRSPLISTHGSRNLFWRPLRDVGTYDKVGFCTSTSYICFARRVMRSPI
jgi:hypothetical protein